MINRLTSSNCISKALNKRKLEDCGNGPMSKYRKVLEEAVKVTSTNKGFRTIQHSVATYEQRKKGLSVLLLSKKNPIPDPFFSKEIETAK